MKSSMRPLLFAALFSIAVPLGSCGSLAPAGASGSRNVISLAELQEERLQPYSTFEAIQRLRPNWLRSRAGTISSGPVFPVVVMDGRRFGELDTLLSVPVADVQEIRFRSAGDATTRYGTGYMGGAIEVITRR